MDLSQNDLRRAVLQRLDTFTDRVDWIGDMADYAFADSVIEFAKWYADVQRPTGRCGAEPPTLGWPADDVCELPADHRGWHRCGATEWGTRQPAETP